MTTATLNIAKNLTVVFGNYVYMANLGDVVTEANKYDVVNLSGVTKTAKLAKYLAGMIANGYSVIVENWKRENTIADGVVDFSIQLAK